MFASITFDAGTPAWLEYLVVSIAGIGLGAIPTMNTLIAQFALPKRLLGVAVGAMFFFVFMGNALAPAILGSAMNMEYSKVLKVALPGELKQSTNEQVLPSISNPRILLSESAMAELKMTLSKSGSDRSDLFVRTIQAIRTALEASLRYVFIIGAVTSLIAFLLIITIPEVSIEAEVQDRRSQPKSNRL
jgi:hypothetical protein